MANDLLYVRATDATGSSWGTPLIVDSTGDVGQYTSLIVRGNGMPAISYYDFTNGHLKYVRASTLSGSIWSVPITVDSTGVVGPYTSLAIVNGFPAISYFDNSNKDLKYIQADDAGGLSWNLPLTLDSEDSVGTYTSLALVNGNPAISYFDDTNNDLKYVMLY